MSSAGFKVIIVGGGPVGLTAAHALTHANIDFVVLESRSSIVTPAGASLVLLPTGMRVLGQLGLLDTLKSVSTPLGQRCLSDHGGNIIGGSNLFEYMKENHGVSSVVVSRHDLTEVIYTSLPPERQACMLPNKKVSGISNTDSGVVVSCADGTSYEGSIVIGTDGAHSKVRDQMRLLALQTTPEQSAVLNAETPFLTTYRALWIRFPIGIELHPGQVHEAHGVGMSTQLFAGDDTVIAALYEQLEIPTRKSSRYTEADQDALVERWANLSIAKGLTVRQAYDRRTQADLVDLEEGVVEHWSSGRIVLGGDAAHKYTPITGSGYNTGIVDVVVLVNELHKITNSDHISGSELKTAPPYLDLITTALKAYSKARFEPATASLKASAGASAMATWQSIILRILDKYVFTNSSFQKFFVNRSASIIARSPVFDFIGGPEPMEGKVPWVQPIRPKNQSSA